jgi:hypothetical protein
VDLLSYDAKGADQKTACGSTRGKVNAFYCPAGDSVAWDRGVLLPMLRKRFGPMSVVTVLAHEFGHAVQFRLGDKAGVTKSTPTIVTEQQADCFAGGYFRWVAEGKSQYYQVSTAEGLNQVLATMFFIRDQAGDSASAQGAHGTAFDRTFAFQTGFEKGPKDCAAMNVQNVKARITDRTFTKKDAQTQGDTKIDQKAVNLLKNSLDEAFKGAGVQAPEIVDQGGSCPNGKFGPADGRASRIRRQRPRWHKRLRGLLRDRVPVCTGHPARRRRVGGQPERRAAHSVPGRRVGQGGQRSRQAAPVLR